MYKPPATVINPETGLQINVYSDDINRLINKGYKLEDLLNIIEKDSYIGFTGNQDTDLTILLALDETSLNKMCNTTGYMKNLCDNSFWKRRILQEYPNLIVYDVVDWYYFYKKIFKMKKMLDKHPSNSVQIIIKDYVNKAIRLTRREAIDLAPFVIGLSVKPYSINYIINKNVVDMYNSLKILVEATGNIFDTRKIIDNEMARNYWYNL